ncbi:MAG: hypothetical protein J6K04_03320, partial [Lachnospiraceae bacterium]|nr:hypothetical protein [Lachnospiraceae bacterium]
YITLNGIPISLSGCQASECAVEGRSLFEVTHLASLGVKIREPAFRDKDERESSKVHKRGTTKESFTKDGFTKDNLQKITYQRWQPQKKTLTKDGVY